MNQEVFGTDTRSIALYSILFICCYLDYTNKNTAIMPSSNYVNPTQTQLIN